MTDYIETKCCVFSKKTHCMCLWMVSCQDTLDGPSAAPQEQHRETCTNIRGKYRLICGSCNLFTSEFIAVQHHLIVK